jgi:hypothetical protein
MAKGRKKKDKLQINIRLDRETNYVWQNYIKKSGIDGSKLIRKYIRFFFSKELTLEQERKRVKLLIEMAYEEHKRKMNVLNKEYEPTIQRLKSELEEIEFKIERKNNNVLEVLK